MNLNFLLFLFFFLLWIPASFGENQALRFNFSECANYALKNNAQIHASSYDINLAKGKYQEANPKGIPVIKYEHKIAPVPQDVDNAAGSFFDGDMSVFNSFKIELGAPIYTFGKLATAKDLAQLGIDASWFTLQKTKDDIVLKIYQIYQGILLAGELKGLAQQAEDSIQKKLEQIQQSKVVDQLELLKLKVAQYEVQRKVEETNKKESLAWAALRVQLGLEDDQKLSLKDSSLIPVNFKLEPLEIYLAKSRDYLPQYKLLEAGVRAKSKKLTLDKKEYLPNLGYGGFFDIGRAPNITGDEDDSSFTNPFNYTKAGGGFQLKGELDFNKTSAKVKQSQADFLKTSYQKSAAIRGLELDIKKSYLEVIEAKNLSDRARDEKKAARQMVFLTKSNLDIGLGEKKDYLDALQSYLVFQGREFESIYNYNIAVSELKTRIGEFHNPDEERY
ncbi:MAG: hypothetical protein A3G32_08260 [Deltaproteobacteria bacterium RIFCSPLOWO2_12_FULL_40_28]|nr:MAG: hypothetical protein A3C45_00960 [Deltaproteobacteria bacterium RIFCSPHIGHO2_02_FULL_40_28]OGQ20902.1 MAG: hypothetical protein A3E27_03625 [Deltaproteobacteria bacterium RIFCSPHIGHO2_12_FULL_40_32]OGQ39303.1 MAG: hypothetical protein A3I69_04985 [Deltaproteobacteria bacterium RIFCSPLOWO2_02_FULL_40_36]OGQ54584.1 MAG: hypothetical protein A3G32_08260 [Deltaproteobacteria bacterium RIFCSPLOWO2_12_FULL_40_28]